MGPALQRGGRQEVSQVRQWELGHAPHSHICPALPDAQIRGTMGRQAGDGIGEPLTSALLSIKWGGAYTSGLDLATFVCKGLWPSCRKMGSNARCPQGTWLFRLPGQNLVNQAQRRPTAALPKSLVISESHSHKYNLEVTENNRFFAFGFIFPLVSRMTTICCSPPTDTHRFSNLKKFPLMFLASKCIFLPGICIVILLEGRRRLPPTCALQQPWV